MTLRSAYIGHAPSRDSCEIRGTLEKRDACAIYRRNGRTIAVATIGRDRLSLTSRPPWSKGTQPLSTPFCGINKITSPHNCIYQQNNAAISQKKIRQNFADFQEMSHLSPSVAEKLFTIL